jgi:hypothetical protein
MATRLCALRFLLKAHMSLRLRTRPGLGIIERCLQSIKEAAMPARRFQRIAGALFLVVVFGACVLIEQARAQPGFVPPVTPLPPPVFNPSSPNTVPQPSYQPIAPTTPSTAPSGEVTSPVTEEAPNTSARSERQATAAKMPSAGHHHRGRLSGPTLGSDYCGYSPCVRIVVADRASVLWWPGFYDYADGQFGRGRPRYGGYPRPTGYHGD